MILRLRVFERNSKSNRSPATGTVSDSNCDVGFAGIGQTWSSAKPLKASGHDGGASPLLIFGGGYDTCEDRDPHGCTSASKGNKIYGLTKNPLLRDTLRQCVNRLSQSTSTEIH